MRTLCGVPAGARLAGAARFVSLRAPLSAAPLVILVDAKARLRDLRHHAIAHLHHNGITDTDLFGIAVLYGEDYLFPELESKLSKYAPKSWRSSHTHGLDGNGRPLLELYLRVQFHVDAAALEPLGGGTRQLYAQHLRQEAVARSSLSKSVRTRLGQILRDEDFLQEACAIDQLNAHCYRLRVSKREPEPGSVRLYVRASGITVAPDTRPPAFFPWPSIGKLSFDRKRFEIRAGESRITLFSSVDVKSKLLLALCRDTHLFSMKTAIECSDSRVQEEVGGREKSEQRTSVISAASSNTTSGIASDRVQSEDETEGILEALPTIVTEDLPSTITAPSETSGVYTMNSSAMPQSEGGSVEYGETGQVRSAASVMLDCVSFYNEGSYVSEDSVDGPVAPGVGFRERADSVASATGSFRGDGSDPTDRQHGPLSAEELTDLIVGRDDYPLLPPADPALESDSESDYMTLLRTTGPSYLPGHEDTAPSEDGYPESNHSYSPPPPVPPKRIDSAKNHMLSLPNVADIDIVDGFGSPHSYEVDRRMSCDPLPLSSTRELSDSLRELKLGIPIREPPPYPGRACPVKLPTSAPMRTLPPLPTEAERSAPPPPPPLTVYTSQLARSQIEQYRRQLYSDVDYVVYPLQDPAVSHQDYLDSKLIMSCSRGGMCRGSSAQALSDTYIRLPACVTTSRKEPPLPTFTRTMSDDNILNSLSVPRSRRLPPPPPPPPPPYPRRSAPPKEPPRSEPQGHIDIKALREKSKNLDLPLIAALCNDKSLLKQTKAFVMPRHGTSNRTAKTASMGLGVGMKGRRGCHRHPGDALPELPISSPRATNNTYVPDPHTRPSAMA